MIARRLLTLSATAATCAVFYALGAASTGPAETPEPARPVSVSIIYDQYGEASDVDLTDANGEWIPTGSIAESFPDNTDEEI